MKMPRILYASDDQAGRTTCRESAYKVTRTTLYGIQNIAQHRDGPPGDSPEAEEFDTKHNSNEGRKSGTECLSPNVGVRQDPVVSNHDTRECFCTGIAISVTDQSDVRKDVRVAGQEAVENDEKRPKAPSSIRKSEGLRENTNS